MPTHVSSNQPVKPQPTTPLWRRALTSLVRYGIPLAVSVLLIVWLMHKVNIHEVESVIRHGCDFRWIALMMVITTLSHIIRGNRWGIQLRAAGLPRMSGLAYSVSIFGAYALNLVFPQAGEAWRCVYMSRRGHVPLSTVVGTDLGDRGSDAVVVMLLTLVAFVVAHPAITDFMTRYSVGRDVEHFSDDPLLWCVLALVVMVVWALFHFGRRLALVRRIDNSVQQIWHGFSVLFTMPGRGAYVLLTAGIWTCYFLETYVCFFAFPFTRELITTQGLAYGLVPGLVVFVFGSFSMAVPSNGGLGPWNLAVMFALSLYGIDKADGTAFSLVMWGCQAAMLVALGLFSAVYIAVTSRKPLPGTNQHQSS